MERDVKTIDENLDTTKQAYLLLKPGGELILTANVMLKIIGISFFA